jgi:hypothetical protein
MPNVSRPLIALLVGTVAFFALWIVALKPSSSTSGGSKGVGAYQPAIDKAHQAVAASGAQAGTISTPAATQPAAPARPATASHPAAAARPASAAKPAVRHQAATAHASAATPRQRLNVVEQALLRHKTIALLFYNPAASDDRAVKQELSGVSTHGGRVVKLAVPVSELANYTVVTNQVQVTTSPTLVLIDHHAQATTLTGYADQFTIAQRVDDALAA